MTQEQVIKKVLFELKQSELISSEAASAIEQRFNWVYVIGFENGAIEQRQKLTGHNRKVVVVFHNGKQIYRFETIHQLQKALKYTDKIVQPALRTGEPTYKGHVIKYEKDVQASQLKNSA